NAFTTGTKNYQVVVSSSLVTLLSPRELMFVIGHELGHILSEHVLYSMFAMWFPAFAVIVGQATLGLGSLLGKGLELAVLDWQRKAELTCDRFGLLICQDLNAAMNVLMKFAGAPPSFYSKMNWKAFADQGRDFDADSDLHNKVYRTLLTAHQTHPWPAVRAHHLREWADAGHYDRLLGNSADEAPAQTPTSGTSAEEMSCIRCEASLLPEDKYCPECGMGVPENIGQEHLFCLECGCEDLRADDKFCPSCGFPF
ncbi:MAG: M48 family metallopeptidase, partial [Bradymonadaceae bacterium]